jgi:hypothetical protein
MVAALKTQGRPGLLAGCMRAPPGSFNVCIGYEHSPLVCACLLPGLGSEQPRLGVKLLDAVRWMKNSIMARSSYKSLPVPFSVRPPAVRIWAGTHYFLEASILCLGEMSGRKKTEMNQN